MNVINIFPSCFSTLRSLLIYPPIWDLITGVCRSCSSKQLDETGGGLFLNHLFFVYIEMSWIEAICGGSMPDLAVIWISDLELLCVSFNAKYSLLCCAALPHYSNWCSIWFPSTVSFVHATQHSIFPFHSTVRGHYSQLKQSWAGLNEFLPAWSMHFM